MSASADKVQSILQSLLEDSVPLLKKGIFTQDELRVMMTAREKHEHAMLKPTYQLSDYLTAIEYEYAVERQRRCRIENLASSSNPLFKKQAKTDFVIVKRILRLWDRTMHKYRYRLHLWQQYLQFCVTIGSKRHFYKALTKALRFLPFEVLLWRIGAAYAVEIGHNPWQARRILMKGIKLVPAGDKNMELAFELFRFEIYFMRRIVTRRKIIVEGQDEVIKMIVPEQSESSQEQEESKEPIAIQEASINLDDYDSVLWLVVEEAFRKNGNTATEHLSQRQMTEQFMELIESLQQKEQEPVILKNIKKIKVKLAAPLKLEESAGEVNAEINEQEILDKQMLPATKQVVLWRSDQEKLDFYKKKMVIRKEGKLTIDWLAARKAIQSCCLKPTSLTQIYQHLLDIQFKQGVQYIINNKSKVNLTLETLSYLILRLTKQEKQQTGHTWSQLSQFICDQIDRRITPMDYKSNMALLKRVVQFNIDHDRAEKNSKLHRSINIQCRGQPEFVERCSRLICKQ